MTFQIGLVARGGLIIARDRKSIDYGRNLKVMDGVGPAIRHSSEGGKTFWSEQGNIVCAFSGDDFGRVAAREAMSIKIAASTPYHEIESTLVNHFNLIWNRASQNGQPPAQVPPMLIIGLLNQVKHQLWRVEVQKTSKCDWHCFQCFGGDGLNPAVYFPQAYYGNRKRSLEELLLLVVHTIREAHKLNPTLVGGLDIFITDQKGDRMLEREEIRKLERLSHTVHRDVESLLFKRTVSL